VIEKKGVDMRSGACKLIYSINEYFKREMENKGPLISFPKDEGQVAAACGVGKNVTVLSGNVNLHFIAKEKYSEP
jgi:hypothetical protein